MNKPTELETTNAAAGRFKHFIMLWRWIGSPDAWLLMFLGFAIWSTFLSEDTVLMNIANTLIGFGILVIWLMVRIADALEKQHDQLKTRRKP